MRLSTREALRFLLEEMGERLLRTRRKRETLAGELAELDAELAELERRMVDVEADLNAPG